MGYKVGPRLREYRLLAPLDAGREFTQPRVHLKLSQSYLGRNKLYTIFTVRYIITQGRDDVAAPLHLREHRASRLPLQTNLRGLRPHSGN